MGAESANNKNVPEVQEPLLERPEDKEEKMKSSISLTLILFISVIASSSALASGYSFFSYKPLLSISAPEITSAELYPPKVKEGDVLLITAELNDVAGISSALAEIDTEAGKDRIKLHLTDGNVQSGIWRGHWIAHSTKNQKWYNLSIYATNVFGRQTILDTKYFDPVQNHSAAEVTAGTFDSGNFTFQNELFVNQKVGIGTTSPQADLHVSNATVGKIIVQGRLNPWVASISLWSGTESETAGIISYGSTGEVRYNVFSNYFPTFYSNNAEAMRITKGGNVGIGSTAPAEKLEVAGAINATGDIYTAPWTDYSASSTIKGWSSFSSKKIFIKKIGKTVFVSFFLDGQSNATGVSFTVPYTAASSLPGVIGCAATTDNGVDTTTGGLIVLSGGSNTVYVGLDMKSLTIAPPPTAWTNSGTKYARGQFWYEAA